jgi:protein-tyrosine phosphatase
MAMDIMGIIMNNMIDIHTHILPLIDDGSTSMEESVSILNKMAAFGFTDIVLTPHYIVSTKYHASNLEKENLRKYLSSQVPISLYLGNEIFIDKEIIYYLKNNEMSSINGKNYVLIELPRNGKIIDLNEIIFLLETEHYIPILAHPERYLFLQEDHCMIDSLLDRGVLLEVNFESITGKYGKGAKKLAKYLLKHKKLHFLASDIHRSDSSFFKKFPKIKRKLIKILGKDTFYQVTYENPKKVLEGKIIV